MPRVWWEKLRYLRPASTIVKANLRKLAGLVCNRDRAACSPNSPALTLSDSYTAQTQVGWVARGTRLAADPTALPSHKDRHLRQCG